MASLQTLKALWVGEPGVGKSRSLWYLYNNDILKEEAFQYASCPTFDESLPVTTFVNGRIHAISVWDSAGGDDYGRLRTLSYPGTHVFVLVFSFSNPSSLQKILSVYLPEVMSYAPEGGPDTSFILVGNKTDLWDSSPSHLPRNPFVDPAVFAAWRCTVLCVLRRCHRRAFRPHVLRHILAFLPDPARTYRPTDEAVLAWIRREAPVDEDGRLKNDQVPMYDPNGPWKGKRTVETVPKGYRLSDVLRCFEGYIETSAMDGRGLDTPVSDVKLDLQRGIGPPPSAPMWEAIVNAALEPKMKQRTPRRPLSQRCSIM